MEFPSEAEVLSRLRMLARAAPDAELIVLSEYTFDGPIPQKVKDWCRLNSKYLIAGGKEPLGDKCFYNMAYVIGPQGTEVFRQAKHVPIQFFNDGLPAPRGEVWHSPWGKIGICICYDLGYTRVVDALVKLGAEALIVPTMDVVDWGVAQHVLHARIAPVRAAEHAIPVFRLASSGISQLVSRNGSLVAQAPFPGEGAVLQGTLDMGSPGSLPLDRWMVWPCVACCLLAPVWHWRRFLKTHPHNQSVTG